MRQSFNQRVEAYIERCKEGSFHQMWDVMATAPKDGTRILALVQNDNERSKFMQRIVWWDPELEASRSKGGWYSERDCVEFPLMWTTFIELPEEFQEPSEQASPGEYEVPVSDQATS